VNKINFILSKHDRLFRKELEKFNDDIEMSILFRNEEDVEDLKQTSYSMSVKNKKAIDDILNSLIKGEQVQKISLDTISSTSSSAFIV
jgi:hypothetical protein